MTQIVGRVLRQPYQERTPFAELNESYVYCLYQRAGEIARQVKAALEKEGYEGDAQGLVVNATDDARRTQRTIAIRPMFARMYTKPFEGKIYLPRFCIKEGSGKNAKYRPLDYFEHLVRRVDIGAFAYRKIDWPLVEAIKEAKDRFYRISIGTELTREYETDVDLMETDEQVLAWMAASLKFGFLSFKQLLAIVRAVYQQLLRTELRPLLENRLALVKSVVRDKIECFVQDELDRQTEAAFSDYFNRGLVHFYLECSECRFEVPSSITIDSKRPLVPLTHDDGQAVQRSLFDFVERESQNEYEQAVALVLDKNADVLWWYRNLVGPENFTIQGYRRAQDISRFRGSTNARGQVPPPRARDRKQRGPPRRESRHHVQAQGRRLLRSGRKESYLAATRRRLQGPRVPLPDSG